MAPFHSFFLLSLALESAMKPLQSFFTRGGIMVRWALLRSTVSTRLKSLLFSLDSHAALGLFAASSVALLTHKLTVILLHRPLGRQFIIYWPFLFGLDLAVLTFLHHALAVPKRAWRVFGTLLCLFIIFCSATFVSLFLEANTSTNWGRSVEVCNAYECADLDSF